MVATKRKVPLDLRSLILPMNNQCWRMTPGLSASWTETWQFETSRASLFAGRKRSSFNCRFWNNGRHRSKHASSVCSNRSQRSHFCLGMGIPCTSGTSWAKKSPNTYGVARFVGYFVTKFRWCGSCELKNTSLSTESLKKWTYCKCSNIRTPRFTISNLHKTGEGNPLTFSQNENSHIPKPESNTPFQILYHI